MAMAEGKGSAKAAGWGPAFMDGGSAYDLANRALSAMCKAHDGRGATTLLVDVGAGPARWRLLARCSRRLADATGRS
jgi:N-acetylglucosamine kinase-like BadF-type ATPase